MADNRLNLIVAFTGIDKLTPALKNIIGLGKSGRQSLAELMSEQRRLNKEVGEYDRKLKGASGSVTTLWNAQKKLLVQQEAVGAQIQRQKRLMAIDGRTVKMTAAGSAMVGSGMSTLMFGAMAAAPLYEMAKSAGEIEGLTNRLRVLGLGTSAVADLRAYADAMNIAGSSTQDNMRYLVEAQGVFRETGAHSLTEQVAGAKLMAPIMARLMTTSKALGHELTEDQERYFLRFIEQAGGVNDPRRAAQLSDGLFRAIQSSGGNVDPANYQSFMARAGTAGMRLSARSMFADFEPLIAELHEAAGVGLQSAYARMNGLIKNSTGAAELLRLGVWDKSAVELNSLGGVKRFIGGKNPLGQGMADQLATSPIDFYMQIRDRYAKAGIKDVQRENMLLFGRTGGALFNLIEKQLPTIIKSRAAYQRTQSLDTAYNNTKDSFFGAGGQMNAAWKNFLVTAGTKGGLLDMMVAGLRAATGALRMMTAAANTHPLLFRVLATTVASLIGLRIVTAALKVTFGGMLGPLARVWGWFEKAGIIQRLVGGRAMGGLANILIGATQGFGGFGIVLEALTGPIGWIIGGVTLLAAGATLIYRNWSGISAFFHKHWTRLRNLFLTAMVLFTPFIAAFVWAVAKIYNNWGSIKAAFADGINWVKTKWIEFTNWFGQTTLGKLLAGAGNIASGIGQGIKKYAGKALDSVGEFADDVGGRFANNLQIKSPSRVFMAFGQHIADGLAIGIDQHSNRPFRSMDRLGRSMTTSFASAGAGARGSHGTVVNNWHITHDGSEDNHTFARRVVRVMDRHQRNDQRRSFGDDF